MDSLSIGVKAAASASIIQNAIQCLLFFIRKNNHYYVTCLKTGFLFFFCFPYRLFSVLHKSLPNKMVGCNKTGAKDGKRTLAPIIHEQSSVPL